MCLPLALPITGPLAALLQRRSLPLSSERLPACLLEKWQKIKANGPLAMPITVPRYYVGEACLLVARHCLPTAVLLRS